MEKYTKKHDHLTTTREIQIENIIEDRFINHECIFEELLALRVKTSTKS